MTTFRVALALACALVAGTRGVRAIAPSMGARAGCRLAPRRSAVASPRAAPRASSPPSAELRARADTLGREASHAELQAERTMLELERLKLGRAKQRATLEAERLGLTSPEAIAAVRKRAADDAAAAKASTEAAAEAAAAAAIAAMTVTTAGLDPALAAAAADPASPAWGRASGAARADDLSAGRERALAAAAALGASNSTAAAGGRGAKFSPYGAAAQLDVETLRLVRERVLAPSGAVTLRSAAERGHPLGAYFKIELKGQASAASALAKLEAALAAEPALAASVRLFLTYEPEPTAEMLESADAESFFWGESAPIVLVVNRSASEALFAPQPIRLALAPLGAFAASFSCLSFALSSFLLQPGFASTLSAASQPGGGDLADDLLQRALPVALAIGALQLAHDVAHAVAATATSTKLGLPVLVPSLQTGLFGTVTPLGSHPRTRAALFDVGFSGPAAGALASLATLAAGLTLSAAGPTPDEILSWPVIPVALLKSSSLVAALAIGIDPDAAQGVTATVHPLVLAGYVGVVVNALNLLPLGRTDGGRVSQALLGPNSAPRALSALALLGLGVSSLFSEADIFFFYGLFAATLQGRQEVGCEDELTPVGQLRTVLSYVALVFVLGALLPLPGGLDPFPSPFLAALG